MLPLCSCVASVIARAASAACGILPCDADRAGSAQLQLLEATRVALALMGDLGTGPDVASGLDDLGTVLSARFIITSKITAIDGRRP